ncbi:hypothetical protein Tco_0124070 [Tanacetum coccineum]
MLRGSCLGFFFSTCRFNVRVLDLDTARTLQIQLGGLRCRMSWRQFILALSLHTPEEIESDGFRAYWADSSREMASKADLRDYWIGISSAGDFLTTFPAYTDIRDPLRRLCHRLIAFSIAGRGRAPKKVTTTDLFFLRSMDEGMISA